MLCMKFSARISFFLCLIARVMITTKADEDLESYYCPNTTTFSPNTTYQTNLNELLSSLSSNSHRDNGFYNTTSGVTDPAANTVYGAFLCRGDLTADECGDCVSTAAKEVLQLCPVEKDTVIWYENCMLRYADRSFFSTIEQYPTRVTVNMYNVPESERNRFTQELRDTMKATATEASNGGADKKFATREANFPGFQNLYTLAQCTPDLSVVDCDHCLAEAIAKLPDGRPGVRINNPSCRIRYEIFQFYNQPAVPTPEQPGPKGRQKGQDSRTIVVVVVVSVVVAGILFCFAYRFLWTKMKKSYKAVLQENFGTESTALESLQFSLATIEAATNKFSHENKIGKGGFGEVYKGILFDGRQVAIKRLSRSSGQGAVEFKNEILVIAKLQHRNLVTLLGFCLEGEEKILVYEYVPNNSLDYFLFGTQKRSVLNWSECYQIIGGIAQGILYLHKYSRLKIIHRDLKPSNILLDDNMNPKISDFGMAKIVGIDEDQGSTNRVVGTLFGSNGGMKNG